jgi:hypothetical protein
MEISQLAYVALMGAGMAGWYFYQQRRVKAEGGLQGAMERAQTIAFGLLPGEKVSVWWHAIAYVGPLAPATQRGVGEKIVDAVAGFIPRGRAFRVAITDQDRLVVAIEPFREGEVMRERASVADDGFRPFAAFYRGEQPGVPPLIPARDYFGDAHALREALANPVGGMTSQGTRSDYELLALRPMPGSDQPTLLWVEPSCEPRVREWQRAASGAGAQR